MRDWDAVGFNYTRGLRNPGATGQRQVAAFSALVPEDRDRSTGWAIVSETPVPPHAPESEVRKKALPARAYRSTGAVELIHWYGIGGWVRESAQWSEQTWSLGSCLATGGVQKVKCRGVYNILRAGC